MLQGGANVWLQAVKSLFICGITPASDVVFVGTKDTGTATGNKVCALYGGGGNVATTGGGGGCNSTTVAKGGILWTYTGTAMDIISSTPYVDFTNNTVWVTSRSAGVAAQASVWKFNAANGTLLASWDNTALGESDTSASAGIDSSPVPNADGAFVYVGTNFGNLKAIKVSDNSVFSHTPASGAGPIKGMPWPISYNTIGQTTSIAYVNSASTAMTTGSTSCAATLPSVTAGNMNIVVVALRQVGSPVSTISDGASTYSREVSKNNTTARTEIWSAKVVAGASTTVTVTLSAGSEVVCAVAQYSGVGALGLTNTNSGTGTAPTVSVTTQDDNNWAVAGFAHEGATGTLSAQTGTLRQVKVTSGSSVKGALTDNTSATPASVTNAVTATQTGTNWAAAALELRTKSTDTIIFSRNATVHSVDFNGAAFSANWTTTPTGGPTVSTPVDDGAGNIYIGGSDGKVHRLLVSDGSDAAQVPATGVPGTMGDPTFNYDLNKIHVGASDGHIYTFATGF